MVLVGPQVQVVHRVHQVLAGLVVLQVHQVLMEQVVRQG